MTSKRFTASNPMVLDVQSPNANFSVVFEDDGETGYLYALDHSREAESIVDAVLICNVASLADRERQSTLKIVWSPSGDHALLLINLHPHAVFDFAARRGYCRTAFPAPDSVWTSYSHDWDDAALRFFRLSSG